MMPPCPFGSEIAYTFIGLQFALGVVRFETETAMPTDADNYPAPPDIGFWGLALVAGLILVGAVWHLPGWCWKQVKKVWRWM